MGTTTPNLLLYKPASTDVVNVVTDINNNMDTLDDAVQDLRDGSATGYLKLIGGKVRTADASATSGTTELEVVNSGSLSLPANSAFLVDVMIKYSVSAIGDDFDFRIRDTNTAGTQRQEIVAPRSDNAVPYVARYGYIHKTTTAETKTFIASIQRIFGAGTATANTSSYLLVYYLGPSSLVVALP